MSEHSFSAESGISSNNAIEPITAETFDSVASIQGSITNIQNLLDFLKNCRATQDINTMDKDHLKSKLQEISTCTYVMRNLLSKQDSIDAQLKEKIKKVSHLLADYEDICSSYQVTTIDKDIDRILHKINLMRTTTQILLSEYAATNDLPFNESLSLLDIVRHVYDARPLYYYNDKLGNEQ